MTGTLDNLVRTGQLKREPPAQQELDGLIRSALARLRDAENITLSLESRFDLAYNAAHALSLAALRSHGFQAEARPGGGTLTRPSTCACEPLRLRAANPL